MTKPKSKDAEIMASLVLQKIALMHAELLEMLHERLVEIMAKIHDNPLGRIQAKDWEAAEKCTCDVCCTFLETVGTQAKETFEDLIESLGVMSKGGKE